MTSPESTFPTDPGVYIFWFEETAGFDVARLSLSDRDQPPRWHLMGASRSYSKAEFANRMNSQIWQRMAPVRHPDDRLVAEIVRGVRDGEIVDESDAIVHLRQATTAGRQASTQAWAAVQSCIDVLSAKAGKHDHEGAL